MSDGKINFSASIDTTQLEKDAKKAMDMFADMSEKIGSEGKKMDKVIDNTGRNVSNITEKTEEAKESFGKLGTVVSAALSITALQGFARQIINIRGEIESLQTSFRVLAGDVDGSALFAEIKQFATATPMSLGDIAKAAQTLLAFNIPANEIMTTLRQLGDVSMGDGQKFQSLALSFAQMSSAGRLMGQDLMQMINAGFNPLSEISAKTGKSIGDLKKEMEQGAISVEMVKEAFASATGEGGKFNGMMEKQSQTIKGAISNMEGAFEDMLNAIGEKMQGVVMSGIAVTQSIIENWDKYARVILSVVASVGAYKAALIAVQVIEKASATATLVTRVLNLAKAYGAANVAAKLLNKTMLANPYTAVAMAIASVVGLLVAFVDTTDQVREAQDRLGESTASTESEFAKAKKDLDGYFVALQKAKEGTEEYDKARDTIVSKYSSYMKNIDKEITKVGNLKNVYDQLTISIQQSIAQRGLQQLQSSNLDAVGKSMDEALSEVQEFLKNAPESVRAEGLKQVREYILTGANEVEGTLVAKFKKTSLWNTIFDARKAQTAALAAEKAFKERFGVEEQSQSTTTEPTTTTTTTLTEPNKADTAKLAEAYRNLYARQAKEREKAKKEAEYAIEQSAIDMMDESTDKTIRQIRLNSKKEQDAVAQALEDYKAKMTQEAKELWQANPATKDTEWDGSILLDPDVLQSFADRNMAIVIKYAQQEADIQQQSFDAMNEYLLQYGSYEEKRQAIKDKYSDAIAKATTEGEKLSLGEEMKQALSDLDIEANKSTSAVSQLFKDLADETISELNRIHERGKEALDFLVTGEWDADKGKDLGISKETFEIWSKSPEQLEKIRKALLGIQLAADKSTKPLDKIAKGLKEIFKLGEDSEELDEALRNIVDGVNEITRVVDFASGSIGQLGEALGSDALQGTSEAMSDISNIANSTMQGAQAGAAFGPWGAAAGAALGLITSATSAISKWIDKTKEAQIASLQSKIDELSKSYDSLSKSIQRAFSTDASKLYQQQNAMLQQQQALIRQQIALERSKKKEDSERIKQWEDELTRINETLAENREKAIDAIFGSDIQSAIDSFASAYVDAWSQGENKAKSAKDFVKSMIQSMIREAVKADFSLPMQAIRKKMNEFFTDGIISTAESTAIEQMVNDAMAEADKRFGWASQYLSAGTSQTTTSKGFQAMSQDTADELNGRFTALQMSGEAIKNAMLDVQMGFNVIRPVIPIISTNIGDIRNLSIIAIDLLEMLVKQTKPIADINTNIERIERNTRKL